MIQETTRRTPEEIAAARNRKAEDVLAYDLYLYLKGETPEDWRGYVQGGSSGLTFLRDAKSANHKAMAATLSLVYGVPGSIQYWRDRLQKELEGGEWGLGEPRSNKYSCWSLASICLVWEWASNRGHTSLMDRAGRYYAAWVATSSLGSVSRPAGNLVGDKWNGPYASGVGVRSDPGHLVGDPRAWVLQAELDILTDGPLMDSFRLNAEKRRRDAEAEAKTTKDAAELRRRKAASELWWRDAIVRARKAGLRVEPLLRLTCLALMGDRSLGHQVAKEALANLPAPGCRYTFHFHAYGDGTHVAWLEDSRGERCIFGERIDPDATVRVLFPYPAQKGNQRGGTCGIEGGRLVARSSSGEDSLELPGGEPTARLVWGPNGLREEPS